MQRRLRGRARHDGRPAGDRPRHQDAHRPGRRGGGRGPDLPGRRLRVHLLPGRRRADRHGLGRHARGPARGDARPARPRGPAAEVHLHGAELPEPGRRDDVAAPPEAARRGGARARAARARGQPVRTAPVRGRAAHSAASLDGGDLRDVPRHLLEDPLARDPARLGGGAAAGAREDQPRQAGGGPVHVHAVAADGAGVLRARDTGATTSSRSPRSTARAATRCSTRSPTTSRRRPSGRGPSGGLFIWATLPDFIDTTDLLARALRENVAFVPGRGRVPGRPRPQLDAAQLLGLGRGRDPRGGPPHRRGRDGAGAALRDAHGRDRGGAAAGGGGAAARAEPTSCICPTVPSGRGAPATDPLLRRSRSPRA